MSADPPWEPPLAGTEVEQLLGALDRQRMTFRWKADGLDASGLATGLPSSTLTLGGLLKHLAVAEDTYSSRKLSGTPLPAVWDDNGWDTDDGWEFTSARDDDPADLYAGYDAAVERSRARFAEALAERGPDGEAHVAMPDGRHASVRRLLLDLLEEYGRRTGHADLIREAVDGRTGEDPPEHWVPPQQPPQ
ncbi:DUF664 domain-containing protein [Phycicoccus sonneratiae]|uniref:DUF664 domain-containing protein n=1 Tax=Phycicoccus sonneratiae TaxID=2807628 RepID=A0ABS2CQ29_9MICO|nr:DUF664 domain-containing protein [Phycicoccus sonneraticus]MBM6401154.1 DUF664 domain-containing protein [Phycicoccus sonneraticus]